MTAEQVKSKAERAQEIFTEVNGVRAEFMKRATEELGMSKAGAATYYQNSKTRAAGGKVKHYYKSKSKKAEEQASDTSAADAQLFDVLLVDGQTKSFMSQEAADEWKAANPDQVAPVTEAAASTSEEADQAPAAE